MLKREVKKPGSEDQVFYEKIKKGIPNLNGMPFHFSDQLKA